MRNKIRRQGSRFTFIIKPDDKQDESNPSLNQKKSRFKPGLILSPNVCKESSMFKNRMKFKWFSNPKRITKKQSSQLIHELENYSSIPNEKLQQKIDYFLTPYNRSLIYKKYMDFESTKRALHDCDERYEKTEANIVCQTRAMNEWNNLTHFIIKEDKEIFRSSLNSINNGLYLELENIAKKHIKNASRPQVKKSNVNTAEVKIEEHDKSIINSCDFMKNTGINSSKENDYEKDELSDCSPVLKNHSDVDALLLALRKRREFSTESNEKDSFENNFDNFIKHQLKILQNRKNLRRNKLMNNKMNRSMEISDPLHHPFLSIAKKELKEINFAPLKIQTICNGRSDNDQISNCSPSKKKQIIPLEKIKKGTKKNCNFSNVFMNISPHLSSVLSNSGRQTADNTNGFYSKRCHDKSFRQVSRNVSSMQDKRLYTASSMCYHPMSPEPKIKDHLMFNDQISVLYVCYICTLLCKKNKLVAKKTLSI